MLWRGGSFVVSDLVSALLAPPMPDDHTDGNLVDPGESGHDEPVFPLGVLEVPAVTADADHDFGVVLAPVQRRAHRGLSAVALGRDAVPDPVEFATPVENVLSRGAGMPR